MSPDLGTKYHAGFDDNFHKFWGQVIAQAWQDPTLYQKLVSQPDTTIHDLASKYQGWDLKSYVADYTFAVNQYTGEAAPKLIVAILPLPAKPVASALVAMAGCSSSSSTCCC